MSPTTHAKLLQPLTPKQRRFLEEYPIDFNATQAAIRAGYSPGSARQQGQRLLTNAYILAEVERRRRELGATAQVDAERVAAELAAMGLYDAAEIGAADLRGPGDLAKLPEHLRRVVVGWSWDRHGNFTPRFADKIRALEVLGKHLGMFNGTGGDDLPRLRTVDELDAFVDHLRSKIPY